MGTPAGDPAALKDILGAAKKKGWKHPALFLCGSHAKYSWPFKTV